MPTVLGSLRRLALSPPLGAVGFAARGFPVVASAVTARLERIPQTVVCGFEWGTDVRDVDELRLRLDLVEPELRGFAYEGATMALTVRGAMAGGRNRLARELLIGPGRPHTFLNYIGIGFAMARLPRPLWRGIVPDLGGTPYYPTMSWLAVDGYGFDRAYFDTARWVDGQEKARPYDWDNAPDYFPRAADQGVGRALWFIHGADPTAVAAAVGRFDPGRHGDLWSGVGLAATFAGGAEAEGLREMARRAGPYLADCGQGAVFAARARSFSGTVPAHTAPAVEVLTGLAVAAASELADDVATGGLAAEGSDRPAYEVWRSRVRSRLAAELLSR
ncbi:DUF1702 family protein [Actinoplanes sp. LDG1-06]|uniref:DUF1702 family protein n=1 Tax=Paractinoplanes ovalisporus TaxID=2810368 RepID=A0ABS2AJX9_9ACTN|nr:DUF1702 family protein [Actinoplanes ovalisporus]MBM2620116.1 DUF1702 family protein [Actinoplanes ovalisporus]